MRLPEFFEPLLARQYDDCDVRRIVEGCSVRRVSSLRANALLSSREEVAACLDEAGIAWSSVPWYEDAFVIEGADARAVDGGGVADADSVGSERAGSGVAGSGVASGGVAGSGVAGSGVAGSGVAGSGVADSERVLWDLPLYEQGKIYLQSLSSMLPPLVLGARPGVDILDMCAAPGGKTTQLAALGGKGTRITACEMHAPRAEKLEYNLRKQGAGNVVVMRTDARKLDDFFRFDRILLDAPCSGSGTLRVRDPKLHARFTPKLVEKSCKAQRALLDKALSLLKPGGTLVYSTCSVLACENEDIVRAALKQAARYGKFELEPVELSGGTLAGSSCEPGEVAAASPGALPVLPTTLEGALCVCPTRYYEGFFVAKIARKA